MRKKLTFTPDEVCTCIAAVETLAESDDANVSEMELAPDVKQQICDSCLKKLNAYSPLTYFTKQEYAMLLDALDYVISVNEYSGIILYEAYSAANKIVRITMPS